MTTVYVMTDDGKFQMFPNVSLRDTHGVYMALVDVEPIDIPAIPSVQHHADSGACLCEYPGHNHAFTPMCIACGHAAHGARKFCGALR